MLKLGQTVLPHTNTSLNRMRATHLIYTNTVFYEAEFTEFNNCKSAINNIQWQWDKYLRKKLNSFVGADKQAFIFQ